MSQWLDEELHIDVTHCPVCHRMPNKIVNTIIHINRRDTRTPHDLLICGDRVDRTEYHLVFRASEIPTWVRCERTH